MIGQLFMAIGGLTVAFAIFASVAAMMPIISKRLALGPIEVGMLLAAPMLLGSLARVPVGILSDRFGPKRVYLTVMTVALVPAFLFALANSYGALLLCASLAGLALSLYPVGVASVVGWFPPRQHGCALGFLALGGLGQSITMIIAPLAVMRLGYHWGFWTFTGLAAAWLVVFALYVKDPPASAAPAQTSGMQPLSHPMNWILSTFYFLTFGCFLALGGFLPTYLTGTFNLTPRDAGFRAAGFIACMVSGRPIGGAIADRIGGRRVLMLAFPIIAIAALFLNSRQIVPMTLASLSTALALGLGSGAVFKLVPEYSPDAVGAVSGLVGAMGALGGFFPPIVLGFFRTATGSFGPGFVCLAIFSLGCFALCAWFIPEKRHATQPHPAGDPRVLQCSAG